MLAALVRHHDMMLFVHSGFCRKGSNLKWLHEMNNVSYSTGNHSLSSNINWIEIIYISSLARTVTNTDLTSFSNSITKHICWRNLIWMWKGRRSWNWPKRKIEYIFCLYAFTTGNWHVMYSLYCICNHKHTYWLNDCFLRKLQSPESSFELSTLKGFRRW